MIFIRHEQRTQVQFGMNAINANLAYCSWLRPKFAAIAEDLSVNSLYSFERSVLIWNI